MYSFSYVYVYLVPCVLYYVHCLFVCLLFQSAHTLFYCLLVRFMPFRLPFILCKRIWGGRRNIYAGVAMWAGSSEGRVMVSLKMYLVSERR
ncbi:hypothetical protein BDW02DRAFT_337160 [Decorospora gaudefroyi]|uniref:Uncharacterized protein n=1 Tax=Decorospora gaudefroyi TaxID=184978 RepID=A0A6A5KRJ2_9PLEO|nr:hypothetical protein BDW02DRAFT_337160 [Decorospora gaudefroyi]